LVALLLPACPLVTPGLSGAHAGDLATKEAAVGIVDAHSPGLIRLSDQIWQLAETALRESKSAALLADYAERQGFRVERGVAGMPTAFVASYGSGRPIIGILGEYDALPGISQTATPVKQPLAKDAAGHGCGHNLFGAASLGAAIAVKQLIEQGKLQGTIRFYGTPAEESVGGKLYMIREGLFKDLDVCLALHPDTETKASCQSSQAMVDFAVEFRGKTSHAAFDPWNGRSAVDALELFCHGLNMLREHVKPSVRIHYAIQRGGDVPNVVPEYAKLWCWVRDSKREGVETVMARVRQIVQGAALMADVEGKLAIQSGDYESLTNRAGAELLHKNLTWIGPPDYTDEEIAFAKALQTAAGVDPKGMKAAIQPLEEQKPDPPGGSTDVADVTWNVPTIHLEVATAPEGVPWHAWPVVASSGMSIGHKGMMLASKALTATMVDLFESESARKAVRAEFESKTKGHVYKGYIPDGPPPVP
jgi:aminobenzoyl-glutamate utilization protein B